MTRHPRGWLTCDAASSRHAEYVWSPSQNKVADERGIQRLSVHRIPLPADCL